MSIENRGFASMNRERQRELASRGGRAAHAKGVAHEWTPEEAREAGRKGGRAQSRRRREYLGEQNDAHRPELALDTIPLMPTHDQDGEQE